MKILNWLTTKKNIVFYVTLLVVIVAAGTYKISSLSARPLDSEEIYSMHLLNDCVVGQLVFGGSCYDDGNPPAHYILLQVFQKMVGKGEYSARLPSVVYFMLSATVLVLICIRLLRISQITTALVLLVFTASSFLNHYAKIVRPYSLIVLCSLAVFYCFMDYLNGDAKKKKTSLLIGSVAASVGLYSHYSFTVFIALFILSIFLAMYKNVYSIKKIFYFFVIPFFAFFPWAFLYLRDQVFSEPGTIYRYDFWQKSIEWARSKEWIGLLSNQVVDIQNDYFAIILTSLFVTFNIIVYLKSTNLARRVLGAMLTVTALVYYFTPLHTYFSLPRYMIFITPFAYIAPFFLVERAGTYKNVIVIFFIPFYILFARNIGVFQPTEDWRGVSKYISEQPQEGVIIVDAWYRKMDVLYYYRMHMKVDCIIEFNGVFGNNCTMSLKDIQNKQRIYFIDSGSAEIPRNLFRSNAKKLVEEKSFASINLYIYDLQ